MVGFQSDRSGPEKIPPGVLASEFSLSVSDASWVYGLQSRDPQNVFEGRPDCGSLAIERKIGFNGSLLLFRLRGIYFHERPGGVKIFQALRFTWAAPNAALFEAAANAWDCQPEVISAVARSIRHFPNLEGITCDVSRTAARDGGPPHEKNKPVPSCMSLAGARR